MSTTRKPRNSPRETTRFTAPVLPVRDNVHFPQLVSTLLVGREVSLRALQSAIRKDRLVLAVSQRDLTIDEPTAQDLYRVCTLSEVVQVMPMPDGTMRVVLRGLSRAHMDSIRLRGGFFNADYEVLVDTPIDGAAGEALRREAIEEFNLVASLGKHVPIEILEVLPAIEDTGHLADLMADHLMLPSTVKQELLEELDCQRRLELFIKTLVSERQVLELQTDLRHRVETELGNTQREFFLREQLRLIQSELSGVDFGVSTENEDLLRQIHAAGMPEDTLERAMGELRRLERSSGSTPEGMVIRNYLEWLVALPWAKTTTDRIDVKHAAEILDREHFGLEKVKERILDFLAVRQLSGSLRGPILCFTGPPGVGKTSLGKSIAESLGREFVRVSLGGVRDESEIRGHRRTYVGSMPGRIIQSIKQCGSKNPVFMLDEVDKLSNDFRGDPTSALLEALDPEQNSQFSDHYIEAPFDFSGVFFILTSNWTERIPAPLRDRMEIIQFPSYTDSEKFQIANQYLIPKMVSEHAIPSDSVTIQDEAVRRLIREYTREAGVRGLSREIATVGRKIARKIAEGETGKFVVEASHLDGMLGKPRFRWGSQGKSPEVGAATGLVWTEVGGDLITIEIALMRPIGPEPKIQLTGLLGEVMQESAYAASTYLRTHAVELGINVESATDIHVHVPEGAVPKDGPSAGVTIFTALLSAFSNRKVRTDIAMTGEITLRGNVLAVGGVREKVLAAHRAGIREVILPKENEADLDDIPAGPKEEMTFHLVEKASEVAKLALQP